MSALEVGVPAPQVGFCTKVVSKLASCGMAPTTCACANWKTAQQDGSDDPEEGVDGEKDNDAAEIEML